ncbi:MAG: hypothetical protein H7328_10555 [Bdellovibrio sp.]|nr:hypothetical protein [Bdellovibrio sp.]
MSGANLGFRYSSIYEKRGVVIYRDFQIDPVISLFFFDDRFAFLGDSLDYQEFIFKDQIRFRTKVSIISDDPLLPAYESVKENNPDRPNTYEWSNGFDFYIPGYNDNYIGEAELTYSKDLRAHLGNYFNLTTKFKLFSFTTLNTEVEPNFVGSIGWGDRAHNQYFYGPNDHESGLTDYAYGFWMAFPGKADRHYPIMQIMRFAVMGNSHREATYAQGRNEGYLISFIATYPVLD